MLDFFNDIITYLCANWESVLGQGIGYLGMVMNVLSYQFKKQKNIIFSQFFGSLFFAISFFLLKAYMGALLNALGIIRAIIYYNKTFFKAESKIWTFSFFMLYNLSYIAVFTVFETQPTTFNLIVELLPVIAMNAVTVSFSKKDSKTVRKLGFISSPCWLIYNCINGAIGAIICEVLALISITSAYLRLDVKKKMQ